MSRRLSALALVAGLLPVLVGCRNSQCNSPCNSGCNSQCNSRPGLFTRFHGPAPCQTVGRNSGCFDSATSQPMPYPPDIPANVVPGGAPYPYPPIGTIPGAAGPPPGQLHMPSPSDLISPPAVPVPAPGNASLPYPTAPGVPVKNK